ncbi:HAAS signaling domain-containing protein [Brevibacillus laterosporus]|uniref:HAAS signaling domain-containing protein n=1 Tax=Brevibacillus laterosporus TaxID=1465 RepID=UPI0018F8ACFC|nr:hypothetical protein [Brevibacillus laterosporus]
MNKDAFLHELKVSLSNISAEEREDILYDYIEHFQIGLEEGKSEKEIIEKLGSPKMIAKELLVTFHLDKAQSQPTLGNLFGVIVAMIGVSFMNFVFVLGPSIVILGFLLAGWGISLALMISPILAVLSAIMFGFSSSQWLQVFAALTLCGLGILLMNGMYYATIFMYKLFIRYLKMNITIVRSKHVAS